MLRTAAVSFSADLKMEYPLHVATTSVLRSLHPEWQAHFYLALEGFSAQKIQQLQQSLDLANRQYQLTLLPPIDLSRYRHFRPLHGNKMIFNRLLLPDMVPVDRLLYIDTDTFTTVDISPLFTGDMQGFAAGFIFDERVCECGEADTYRELGLPDDGFVFNSGVVLMNVPQWKSEERTEELLEFCKRKYKNGDQPALNFVFHGRALKLPRKFNITLYPQVSRQVPEEGIFHFVGSPKPWDIAGDVLNPHAHLYRRGVSETALPKFATSKYLQVGSYERALRLMRSYYRIAKLRFDNRRTATRLDT